MILSPAWATTVIPCFKNYLNPGMVVHACNLSTQGLGAGGLPEV